MDCKLQLSVALQLSQIAVPENRGTCLIGGGKTHGCIGDLYRPGPLENNPRLKNHSRKTILKKNRKENTEKKTKTKENKNFPKSGEPNLPKTRSH